MQSLQNLQPYIAHSEFSTWESILIYVLSTVNLIIWGGLVYLLIRYLRKKSR